MVDRNGRLAGPGESSGVGAASAPPVRQGSRALDCLAHTPGSGRPSVHAPLRCEFRIVAEGFRCKANTTPDPDTQPVPWEVLRIDAEHRTVLLDTGFPALLAGSRINLRNDGQVIRDVAPSGLHALATRAVSVSTGAVSVGERVTSMPRRSGWRSTRRASARRRPPEGDTANGAPLPRGAQAKPPPTLPGRATRESRAGSACAWSPRGRRRRSPRPGSSSAAPLAAASPGSCGEPAPVGR